MNADIVAGPVDAATRPLDAARFLGLVKQFFPLSVISVGWTTRSVITANAIDIIEEAKC